MTYSVLRLQRRRTCSSVGSHRSASNLVAIDRAVAFSFYYPPLPPCTVSSQTTQLNIIGQSKGFDFSKTTGVAPFQPSSTYVMSQQTMPTYTDAAVYEENAYPSATMNNYGAFGHQTPAQFTSYMDPVGDDAAELNALAFESMFDTGLALTAEPPFALPRELCAKMMYSKNAALLQEVQVGLEQLIKQPEEFDAWSGAIRTRLVEKLITPEALSLTAEMIIQMAALKSGVQYGFARLCVYLCTEVQNFRQNNLLPMLHRYHEQNRKHMPTEQQQNLLLFFAELYEKLELAGGARIAVMGDAIFEQIESMLDMQAKIQDSSVRTVIQVLKLDGRHLECGEKGVARVDEVFTKLNAFAKGHPALSDSVKQQIVNLSAFRESNWGLKNQETYKSHLHVDSSAIITPSSSSGDLIIGPDGQPLSEEERAFVEDNIQRVNSADMNNEENDFSDDCEEFLMNGKLSLIYSYTFMFSTMLPFDLHLWETLNLQEVIEMDEEEKAKAETPNDITSLADQGNEKSNKSNE
ncbi:unnamed protein product [Anisakis simplex]|uniref:MIF4G domain-containing protein n=1 Tax=Anisakis simplex TaxID=6269 RepID=A0A0M3JT88_ANISI|nr:unnamed protein product [Anisakis simplex]